MTINAIQLMIGYDVIALKSDIDDQNLLPASVHSFIFSHNLLHFCRNHERL
jgi:hypothetical protein